MTTGSEPRTIYFTAETENPQQPSQYILPFRWKPKFDGPHPIRTGFMGMLDRWLMRKLFGIEVPEGKFVAADITVSNMRILEPEQAVFVEEQP